MDKILSLKQCIEKILPESKIIISNIIERLGNRKVALSLKQLNEHLCSLKVDTVDNSNIGKESLGKKGLHLSPKGSGKLAINFMKKIKNLPKKI